MTLAAVALAVALVPPAAMAREHGEDEADVAHKIKGMVVSVDAAAGTVEIQTGRPGRCRGGRGGPREEGAEENAGVSQRRGRRGGRGGERGRRGQRGQTITVSTDGSTRVRRNKAAAQLSDLVEGDKVTVVILTDEETTLEQALLEPADVISAKAKPQPPAEEDGEQEEAPAEGETPAP